MSCLAIILAADIFGIPFSFLFAVWLGKEECIQEYMRVLTPFLELIQIRSDLEAASKKTAAQELSKTTKALRRLSSVEPPSGKEAKEAEADIFDGGKSDLTSQKTQQRNLRRCYAAVALAGELFLLHGDHTQWTMEMLEREAKDAIEVGKIDIIMRLKRGERVAETISE